VEICVVEAGQYHGGRAVVGGECLPQCWAVNERRPHFLKSSYSRLVVIMGLSCYICLMAFFPGQPGYAATRKVNYSGFYRSKR